MIEFRKEIMTRKNSYRDLKKRFPNYIIIQKAGYFYDVRDFGAVFFSENLGYTLYSDKGSKYKVGIPVNVLNIALESLKKSNYKYIITEHYEIVEQYDNGVPTPLIENDNNSNTHYEVELSQILAKERADALTQLLKKYRLEKSMEYNIPPFCVFHNRVIVSLVKYLPTTEENLIKIRGIGKDKCEKYCSKQR